MLYLNLARRLAGTAEAPGDEAELQAAISRAYYAAFIKVRNLWHWFSLINKTAETLTEQGFP